MHAEASTLDYVDTQPPIEPLPRGSQPVFAEGCAACAALTNAGCDAAPHAQLIYQDHIALPLCSRFNRIYYYCEACGQQWVFKPHSQPAWLKGARRDLVAPSVEALAPTVFKMLTSSG